MNQVDSVGRRVAKGLPGEYGKEKPNTILHREKPMVQGDCSTASQRAEWVSHLLAASGTYGVVSHLSRVSGVSRQTLYSWKAKGQTALEQVLRPIPAPVKAEPQVQIERAILTLLVEG